MITEPTYAVNLAGEERPHTSVMRPVTAEMTSIEFRVIRSGSPARRMKLNTLRCTLGSGEGCTVRLNDASLRPMHAVILRDAHRVLLRAYSVPIEVNGHLTGETFLHIGDSFVLGSYHFHLIDAPDVPPSLAHTPTSTPAPAHAQSESPTPGTRGRLSFLGGASYVSEALQLFPPKPLEASVLQDVPLRASQRAESEQLRGELESWQERERTWREQDAKRRDELADAVTRFHDSQERAKDASEAVAQMRKRMSQLTDELESLTHDSVEFREQAASRQERLRQAADDALEARQESLRQRDEALRQRDELFRQHEEAVRDREQILVACDKASQERDESRREREELSRQLERVINERDVIRQERDEIRKERDEIRRGREEAIRERDEAIREREAIATARDEAIAERDEALTLRDQALVASHLSSQQATQGTEALTRTNKQIEQLQQELTNASDQLRDARDEVSKAYARIAALSAESNQSSQYEVELEVLRHAVKQLERECAAAREQAETAANDRQLAQSLGARLTNSEASRTTDRLSWEQEANALQQTIQQLSIEIASAANQISQSEADRESTQAELNEATERLNVAKRELALRPTSEQWDELQNQLAETERQLDETEKQLGLLRKEYDELLGRHEAQVNDRQEPAAIELSNATPSLIAPASPHLDGCSADEECAGDYEWPTYQSPEVAERLQTYTARDEAPRLSFADQLPGKLESVPFVPLLEAPSPKAWAAPPDNLPEPEVATSMPRHEAVETDGHEPAEHPAVGSFAEQLLARLRETTDREVVAIADNVVEAEESVEFGIDSEPIAESHSVWSMPVLSSAGPAYSDEAASHDESEQTYMLSSQEADGVAERFPLLEKVDSANSPFADDHADDSLDGDEDEGTRAFDFSQHGKHLFTNGEDDSANPSESDTSPLSASFLSDPNAGEYRQPETSSSQPDPDDDSIEAYMNRLLQRVQGHSSTGITSTATKSSGGPTGSDSIAKTSSSTLANTVVTETVTASKPIEVIDSSTPLVPRSQAPEDLGNMAAMRELANATAESAISLSVRGQAQQLKSKAIMDLVQGGVVLICAFAFFSCGQRVASLRFVWYTAAGLAAALSIFYIFDMLKKLAAAKASYDRAKDQSEQFQAGD